MFGSPSATTPFGKARVLGSSTPGMSFGQQSASKRKRDQMTPAVGEKANLFVKQIRQSAANTDSDIAVGRLFPRGQFLHKQNPGRSLVFRPHFLSNPTEHVILNKMNDESFNSSLDCGVGPSESFDIVACSPAGRITIANVTADGTQTSFECSVHLHEEDEQITECTHAGNVVMLGSSKEELYLIRRYGRSLTADRLQRNRSLFANLLNSGARFIGIKPAQCASSRIVKALPVPLSCLLVSVGSSQVTLWSEWTNPGSEQVVWEHNLKDILTADVAALESSRNTKLEIIDAVLMPVELGAEGATLLILSAYYPETAPRDGKTAVSAALWLHTLEISLPATSSDAPLRILHRLQLSESAQVKPYNNELHQMQDDQDHQDHHIAPRIYSMAPSWRVFAAWSGPSVSGHASGPTVHGSQVDVLNQSLLNATANFERSSRGAGSVADALKCKSAVDSEIGVHKVVALSAVTSPDGICMVHSDGSVYVLTPPLPKRVAAAFPLQTSTVRDRQLAGPSDKTAQANELTALLHSAALGEVSLEEVGMLVRDGFAALSATEALAAVQSASAKLLSRSSTGRYWAGTTEEARIGGGGGAGGARASSAGALTRYQMVHRLVESKLNAHKQLLTLVSTTDAYDQDAVKQALLRDHQLLLLSAGLSGALEEAQLRLSSAESNVNTTSESTYPSTTSGTGALNGAAEALTVVAQGMERAVRVGRGRSLEDIDSQGLSVADIFYSEAALVLDGVESIVQTVVDAQPSLTRRGLLLETVFGVASIVLSAVQFATVGDGAETAATFIGTNPKLRASLTTLVRLLKDAVSAVEVPLGKAPVGEREGKRIRELCQALLQTFAKDLAGSTVDNEEDMSREWKAQYHYAKGISSALVIATGQYQAAFALSTEHLYCLGLMEATEKEPHLLRARLEDTLRRLGHRVGTDTVPLATGCFLWLEAHHRPADILSLGTASPVLLEEFLKTRSHLSWMHHLRSGHFAAATVAAVDSASSVPQVAKATTLLSIAKLSAKLAQLDEDATPLRPTATPKRLFTASSSSATGSAAPTQKVLENAMNNMHADLAVLRAQEIVADALPNLALSRDTRVPVSELIKLTTRALTHHGAVSIGGLETAEGELSAHPFTAPDPISLVRCFGVSLGLLSMQMDLLDALLSEANVEGEMENSDVSDHRNELRRQLASFDDLLTQLWGALIAANAGAWLELSCYPSLGVQEEAVLTNECWLHAAVRQAVGDAASGNLREELIPADTAGSTGLLQRALENSRVAQKKLGVDGEVEDLSSGQVNQRLVHIVKMCVDMALSGQNEQQ